MFSYGHNSRQYDTDDNDDNNLNKNWKAYLQSVGAIGIEENYDNNRDINSIPDDNVMSQRFQRRNDILEETIYHRCIHPHGGIADTCRNVALILSDRQVYGGSNKVTWQQKRMPPAIERRLKRKGSLNRDCDDDDDEDGRLNSPRIKDGERSPSTVFESPISTTQMPPPTTTPLTPDSASAAIPAPTDDAPSTSHNDVPDNDGDVQMIQSRQQAHGNGNNSLETNRLLDNTAASTSLPGAASATVNNTRRGIISSDQSLQPRSTEPSNESGTVQTTTSSTGNRVGSSFNKEILNNNKYRHVSYPMKLSNEIRMFSEYSLATKYHSSFLNHLGGNDAIDDQGNRPVSSAAVSTISVAFSYDGKTMASTHGDHTVKITCCETGRMLQSLDGHPRTPWTVKYHPMNAAIVASGCLGFQVRVWNWEKKSCLQMIRLEFAIISLSFHPSGKILAIANGTRLHFWGVDIEDNQTVNTGSLGSPNISRLGHTTNATTRNLQNLASQPVNNNGNTNSSVNNRSPTIVLTELDLKHMLRCVHFPPNGTSLIIGGVNPPSAPPDVLRGGRGAANQRGAGAAGGMSFYLRMWDFDLQKALEVVPNPTDTSSTGNPHHPRGPNNISMARRGIISNAVMFVPRALLYNDGGFDVSPDGKTLCACAEFWLPDGVNNASELLYREQVAFDDEMRRKEEEEEEELERATGAMKIFDENQSTSRNPDIDHASDSFEDNNDGDSRTPSPNSLHTAAVSRALATLRGAGSTTIQGTTYYTRLNTSNAGNNSRNFPTQGRSPSFRDGMEHPLLAPPITPLVCTNNTSATNAQPRTPATTSPEPNASFIPLTPPITTDQRLRNLSPPPPPGQTVYGHQIGRRRQTVSTTGMEPLPPPSSSASVDTYRHSNTTTTHALTFNRGVPHAPPSTSAVHGMTMRPPHHFSYISTSATVTGIVGTPPSTTSYISSHNQHELTHAFRGGRYVPHVVMISLDTDPHPDGTDAKLVRSAVARGYRPRLGQLLEACPLDVNKASAVTCVKFSPSTDFCLIGYGVREPGGDNSNNSNSNNNFHPVTAIYRIRGGMTHVSTMLSGDDDVNIARFHPDSGHSFVYGTKQGRVRVLSKRPWNFYDF